MTTATTDAAAAPSAILKIETADLHAQAEQSPFQRDLAKGRLPREQYARHLAQMLHVHEAIEEALWPLRDTIEPVGRIVRDEHRRTGVIREDLAFYGVDGADHPAEPATAALVADIRRFAAERPLALLGMHYVLEGSANGGRFIAMNVRPAYGLEPGAGDRFLDPYGERQRELWSAFKADLDACVFTPAQMRDLLDGAGRMFDGVREIGDALHASA
ncbi:MAG: biliverdin-producing heme oxygenase [Phycisphaerales bacterium]